ncbi:MAG TPA: hypothetical protein VK074_05700, partial [Fodinibius sp.]|nr:hypothetical protein [Fodinibius sp.]
IRPKADGLKPKVQFYEPEEINSLNEWRLLAGPDRSGAPLLFRSEVLFYDLHLESGNTIQSPSLDGLTGFMYLFSGSVTMEGDGGETVKEGDSIIIKGEQLTLSSNEDSDIVFFILDEKAPYSRNGLYTK